MAEPRFLQIHFLAPYVAALLNRDDSGLAKRLPYGGALRTRISSQCLKRHWRMASDPHSLDRIAGFEAAYRSRETIDRRVLNGLVADDAVLQPIREAMLTVVYGEKGKDKKSRQTLLLGAPEVAFLRDEAMRMAKKATAQAEEKENHERTEAGKVGEQDAETIRKYAVEFAQTIAADWAKANKANLKALAANSAMPAGLTGALFGRMVTSDPDANITAPVHVAHAFTVHEEEAESDYFVAVDDLAREAETGADTIQETELTSGLFYGYVVVDLPGLLANLGGAKDPDAASDMAGAVLHNLVHLIAEVSPGAKLGSTAPYGRAMLMMLEAGDRQPRSLAGAYRKPCRPETGAALEALSAHLAALDAAYATGEERRFMALSNAELPGAERASLKGLAEWAQGLPARLVP